MINRAETFVEIEKKVLNTDTCRSALEFRSTS